VQGDKNETSRKEREVRSKELRELAAIPALTWLAQVDHLVFKYPKVPVRFAQLL
jgi:hypothetical protein